MDNELEETGRFESARSTPHAGGSLSPEERITAQRMRARLERACREGIGGVAMVLAGEDPREVCTVFEQWHAEARRPWPWLAGLCWGALELVGLAYPSEDPDGVTVGRLLVGTQTDPHPIPTAIESVATGAPGADEPTTADTAAALALGSLVSAVERFWVDYAGAARRLRPLVVAGDRDAADEQVAAARRHLEDSAERVEMLAQRLVDHVPALAEVDQPPSPREPEPTAPPMSPEPEPAAPPTSPELEPAPPTPPKPPAARAVAPPVAESSPPSRPPRTPPKAPRQGQRPSSAPPRRRRSEQVEYRRIRDHPYAPVVFLIAVSVAAMLWVAAIAGGVLGGS